MYDVEGFSKLTGQFLELNRLALFALAEGQVKPEVISPNEIPEVVQLQLSASFVMLSGAFEFGLRQLLDALACSLVIDDARLNKRSVGGFSGIESTLASVWKDIGVAGDTFGSEDWNDAKLLSEIRNKVVHLMGWHDEPEFGQRSKSIWDRYDLIPMVGLHSMGPVRRFYFGDRSLGLISALYGRIAERLHLELKGHANAAA